MTVVTGGSGVISYQWQSSADGISGWANATGIGATTNTYTPSSAVAGTTYYRVLVNAANNGCDQAVSNNGIAIINPDLVVTTQPSNVNECIGGTNTMTVTITGGSGAITYQWQSSADGSTGWTNATGLGATTNTYTPSSAVAGTTYYRVLVNAANNGCDQAVSNNGIAVINPDLVVTTQPSDVSECIGGTNTMTVAITGGSGVVSYQWQSSADGSTGWANATGLGATTNTYTPSSAVAGTTYYRVLVNAANNGCDQAVSNNGIAVINPDLVVTTQPSDVNECIGGTNTMTVAITGGSGVVSYQWQSSADGSTSWANATGPGATTNTYTPSSATAGTTYYRVLVNAANNGCDQAVSNNGIAVITPDLVVTTQPSNVNECIGGTNTMTVAVTGGSGLQAISGNQVLTDLQGWANATGLGATTNTYTPSSAVAGTTYYRVLVNAANNGCDQAVSNNGIAVINPDLVVTTQPSNVNECIGGTNTMTVAVSGGSGAVTYQWQSSADGSTGWANATGLGATTNTYTPSSAVAGTTYYRVLVNAANNGCDQAVSNNGIAVITPDLVVTTQPSDVNECIGGTNTMNVVVSGGSGTISYQWQSSSDGLSGWVNAIGSGSTTSVFTPPSVVSGTTYYRVLINAANNGCDQAVSNNGIAVIAPDLVVTTQPSNVNECIGGTNTMTVTVSGGSGAISYQWQSSTDGIGGWANATGLGATTNTYTPSSAVAGTTYYRVLVNAANNGCDQAVSNNGIAVINPDLVVTTQPSDVNECIGGTNTMTVAITGGSGVVSYQWQSSADGSTGWANATGLGATTNTYTPSSAVAGTTYYRVLVNAANNGCDQAVSNNGIAVITPDLVVTTQPSNVNECIGGTNTMTVTITGGSGLVSYQWQSSADGSTGWANATGLGATTNIYTPSSAVAGTTYYRILVNAANNGCDQAVSNNGIAIIAPDISITAQPQGGFICEGGNLNLIVTASGSPDIHYQWQQQTGPSSWVIVGTDQSSYNTGALSVTTTYRVFVNAAESGCEDVYSTDVTVVVTPDISFSTQPQSIVECVGGNETMSFTAINGSGPLSYQWQVSANGTSGWTNILNETSTTYLPPSGVAGTLYYRVLVNAPNNGCDQALSNVVNALIVTDPIVTVITDDNEICDGGVTILHSNVIGGTGSNIYQWQQLINLVWTNINGANNADYSTGILGAGSYSYRVLVTQDTGCDGMSVAEVIQVNNDPQVFDSVDDNEICDGGTTTLHSEVIGGAGGNNYQWQQLIAGLWVNITNANSPDYTTNILAEGSYTYRVVVTQDAGCQGVSSGQEILVNADPQVYDNADDNEICDGGTTTLHSEVIGGAGGNSYQWQQLISGSWINILNANNPDYTTDILNVGSYEYRVIVTQDAGCDGFSDGEVIIVNSDPQVFDSAEDNNICEGGTTTLHSEVIGGAGSNNYQWQELVSTIWVDIFGANGQDYTTDVLNVGSFTYRVVVMQDAGCEGVSDGETIDVNSDPVVTDSADDHEICDGGTTTLHSDVTGGAGQNNYQWQILDGTNWIDIFNANGPDYTTEILLAGTYTYRVVVIQDAGCEGVSDGEIIVVNNDPAVFDNADDNEFCDGGFTTLHSEVLGGAGSNNYQWQQLIAGSWVDIFGANSPDYTTDILSTGSYTYRIVVLQDAGCESASDGELIIVNPDPEVFDNADDNEFCEGGQTTLHSEIIGGAGINNYQWQQLSGGVWSNIFNANGPDYTTEILNAGNYSYRVVVTQDSGCEGVSDGEDILVNNDPQVFLNAEDNEICEGGVTSIYSVVVGGAGMNFYQWQELSGGLWIDIFGANGENYTTEILGEGSYTYRVIVNQDAGCSSESAGETIIVNGDPEVYDNANFNQICEGGSATLQSEVVGGAGGNNYQWQELSGGVWIDIFGANADSYITEILPPGSYSYRVVVNQDAGCEGVSDGETIVVTADPQVFDSADDNEFCSGGSTTLHTEVVGGAGGNNYQWQTLIEGVWIDVFGATGTDYTTDLLDAGTYTYRVVVTQNGGCENVSDGQIIVVTADPQVIINADDYEFCEGGSTNLHSQVTGGSGAANYQWQQLLQGVWIDLFLANSSDYTSELLDAGTYTYRVVVTQDAGCEAISNEVILVVNADPIVTDNADQNIICDGGIAILHSQVTGGAGINNYQWQELLGGLWIDIFSANSADYSTGSLSIGSYIYRVIVTQDAGCEGVSNGQTINVTPDLNISGQPSNVNECVGGTNVMTVVVTGGAGVISYQWQSSPNGTSGWVNAAGIGSTTGTFTPPSVIAGTTFYRVLVNAANNGCDQAISINATAVITPDLVITTQPTNVNECVGGTNTMNVVVTGGSGTISYQWQSSADGISGWANATGLGATTSTYTPSSAVAGTTFYRVLVNAANNGCDQAVSSNATAIITQDLVITTQPTD
ncbi:MAG: hypothetical protein IPP15_12015, partial [Saprospiraceae bacterium]|nr:hypothetical protein [Candidatus Opimibacter skivensis]